MLALAVTAKQKPEFHPVKVRVSLSHMWNKMVYDPSVVEA